MTTTNPASVAADVARLFGQIRRLGFRTSRVEGLRQSEAVFLAHAVYLNPSDNSRTKISDLCASLGITQAAATHVMKVLEEKEYIVRLTSERDKRVVLVKPTAAGIAAIENREREIGDAFAGLVSHLGEEQSRELARLLGSAIAYLSGQEEG